MEESVGNPYCCPINHQKARFPYGHTDPRAPLVLKMPIPTINLTQQFFSPSAFQSEPIALAQVAPRSPGDIPVLELTCLACFRDDGTLISGQPLHQRHLRGGPQGVVHQRNHHFRSLCNWLWSMGSMLWCCFDAVPNAGRMNTEWPQWPQISSVIPALGGTTWNNSHQQPQT